MTPRRPAIGFLRTMLLPGLAGALAGQVAVAGLLWRDPTGLRALVFNSDAPWLPLTILSVSFAVTFGSAAIGAAIMALDDR